MNDERFRRNLAYLSDYDWSFDLQVFAKQMRDAAALAHDYPRTTFVLQHAGMLEDLSEEGRARWRDGMALPGAEVTSFPRCRGSALSFMRNDKDHIAAIYRDTVALFGASRCLFGSNFPIEKLWTTYAGAHRPPTRRRRAIQLGRTARHFLETPRPASIASPRKRPINRPPYPGRNHVALRTPPLLEKFHAMRRSAASRSSAAARAPAFRPNARKRAASTSSSSIIPAATAWRGAARSPGFLAYGNANDIVLEMAREVLPVVKHTPVLAGVNGTDPFCIFDPFLDHLKALGFSGVQNFPDRRPVRRHHARQSRRDRHGLWA